MWNFKLVKATNVQYYISIFIICEITVKMDCSCMYIQLYAIKVKQSDMLTDQINQLCQRCDESQRMVFNTSNCRGPAHSIVPISSFCSRLIYFSFFLDERFLHPILEFQAVAKFYKPSLVTFSWSTLTVVTGSRPALASKHYCSAWF